jgi:very-short-patch-repair endonuclease
MSEPFFLSRTRFARHLRQKKTRAEALVWSMVRRKQLLGLKFRRQHPIGGFVVDFYCPALRLVLELDGDAHTARDERAFDYERDSILKGLGYRVVRLRNEDATRENLLRLLSGFDLAFASEPLPTIQERGSQPMLDPSMPS